MNEKDEIRSIFQRLGIAIEHLNYQSNLDYYEVGFAIEGTNDEFIDDSGTAPRFNTDILGWVVEQVDGTGMLDGGQVRVRDTMQDYHMQIEIHE